MSTDFGHRANQDANEEDPAVSCCGFQQASPVSSGNLVRGTRIARSSGLPSSIYRVTAQVAGFPGARGVPGGGEKIGFTRGVLARIRLAGP